VFCLMVGQLSWEYTVAHLLTLYKSQLLLFSQVVVVREKNWMRVLDLSFLWLRLLSEFAYPERGLTILVFSKALTHLDR